MAPKIAKAWKRYGPAGARIYGYPQRGIGEVITVAATEEEITCSSPVPGGKFPFFKRPEFAWFFGVLSVFSPIIPHCFLSVLVPYLRCFLGALAPTHRLLNCSRNLNIY